jgi:hypothetical protein
MRRTRIALVVGSLALLVACAEPSADPDPNGALGEAVERTLAAESFRIRSTVIDGAETHVSQVEYLAPDRVRILLRPSGETIWIGGDTYFSIPGQPGRFVLVETGCDNTLETAVPALGVVGDASAVRRNGPVISFRSYEVEGMKGQARIEGGLLASLLVRYEFPEVDREVIERYGFSGFGRDISIEPPPASSVSTASEVPPVQRGPAPCP